MNADISNPSSEYHPPRLIPAAQWNQFHVWPKPGGLRHLLFHRRTNGLERAVRRVGRCLLIDEQKFFDWIEELNSEGVHT